MALTDTEANAPKKRKRQERDGDSTKHNSSRKGSKTLDARAIPAQSSETALSKTGELDVASFVAAREYEIKALESSLAKSKKALRLRAFQQVPRNMRRRTASHNVKKAPKRMRSRVSREMNEDNTSPSAKQKRTKSVRLRLRIEGMKRTKRKAAAKKAKGELKPIIGARKVRNHTSMSRIAKIKENALSQPPSATSRFKKRQINKTWLPTHLWHAKRAHMTKPKEPLWRMAIPLSPTEKSYRPTHRAAGSRGCIAWDISYMATIGVIGVESSLKGLLKSINFGVLPGEGVGPCWGHQGSKWVAGTRHESDWVRERDGKKCFIGPVMVIWCPVSEESSSKDPSSDATLASHQPDLDSSITTKNKLQPVQKPPKRQLFIRVHPSAFLQLWSELTKNSKSQKPTVVLEDLRFEVGSVELTGAASTESLLGILRPVTSENTDSSFLASTNAFTALSSLTNVASLPRNILIALEACDPRLQHPAKTIKVSTENNAEVEASLAEMLAQWPLDSNRVTPGIFSQAQRVGASRLLSSQKAINRRKTLTPPGAKPAHRKSDPRIPVMLIATRAKQNDAQGSWTLLLPWKCVDAVWRCLMYYPISSGGQPQFGGLKEVRQIAFERGQAWFPGDFPGTEAGKAWLKTESDVRRKAWERKPPSRRVNFATLDIKSKDGRKGELGDPWSCDWGFLFGTMTAMPTMKTAGNDTITKIDHDEAREGSTIPQPSVSYDQLPDVAASSFLNGKPSECGQVLQYTLFTVKITLLTRGTPLSCARVYRLPSETQDPELREGWLSLDPTCSGSLFSPKVQDLADTSRRRVGKALPKHKVNWRGDFRKHKFYGNEREDLEEIGSRFVEPTSIPADDISQHKEHPSNARSSKGKCHVKGMKGQKPQKEEGSACTTGAPTKYTNQTFEDAPSALRSSRAELAQSLLKPAACESPLHLDLPGKYDLIGFVTSGNYNLAEGRGTGFASFWYQKLRQGLDQDVPGTKRKPTERQNRLVIVRNVGETTGRLAIWQPL